MTRRALLTTTAATLASMPAIAKHTGVLRFLRLRHASFLLELDGRRVLIDPTFARDFGFGPFVNAPPPALLPEQLGQIDLLLVSSGRSDHFSSLSLELLATQRPYCLVPDEQTAKRLRHRGHRRVRVVVAGDRFRVRDIDIRVSPAQDLLSNTTSVGYRLARGGRSVWHTGPLPPIDLFGDAAEFARIHQSELVFATADGTQLGARFRVHMGPDDARLLGEVAGARVVVPAQDGFTPSALGGLLLLPAEPVAVPVRTRLTPVADGQWVRLTRPRSET